MQAYHVATACFNSIPLMIVAPCAILSYTAPDVIQYGRNPTNGLCWITEFASSMVALILPAMVLFVFQLVFFVVGSFLLTTSSKGGDGIKRTPYVRILLAMFFSSHITWIFWLSNTYISKPLVLSPHHYFGWLSRFCCTFRALWHKESLETLHFTAF